MNGKLLASESYQLPSTHPALADHFPGNPVIPAALLLDEITNRFRQLIGPQTPFHFLQVKFLRPAIPDHVYSLEFSQVSQRRFVATLGLDESTLKAVIITDA